MKNRVAQLLSVGIALAAVAAVHAQDKTMMANVPFHFYVGSSLMPQGAYRVGEISSGTVVRISSTQTNASSAVTSLKVMGKELNEPARLVFHRYGEDYFLAQIWTGGMPVGRALTCSPREKELAQSGAAPTLAVIRIALHQ